MNQSVHNRRRHDLLPLLFDKLLVSQVLEDLKNYQPFDQMNQPISFYLEHPNVCDIKQKHLRGLKFRYHLEA